MNTKRKEYTIKAKIVFNGEFYVPAESEEQAKNYVMRHCGCVGGIDNIHTSVPGNCDWHFNIYPKIIIK